MRTAIGIVFLLIIMSLAACDIIQADRAPENFFDDPDVIRLVKASARGDIKEMDRMIEKGADINTVGVDGITPLYWLMVMKKEPNKKGFQHLLDLGADPLRFHTPSGRTAFYISVRHPDPDYVTMILKSGVDPNFIHPEEPSWPTALYSAIFTRQFKNIQILLDYGADPEIRTEMGETALHRTANNNWQAAYILLKNGADYTARTGFGGHTIVISLENNRYWPTPGEVDYRQKVVDFLRERGVEVHPWMPPDE